MEGIEKEYTFYLFDKDIRDFLRQLLDNPTQAIPNNNLKDYGFSKSKLIGILMRNALLFKEEKINDNITPPQFIVKYKIPRKNFERKMKKLYIKLFEANTPKNNKVTLEEDGEGLGGATAAADCNNSAPIIPMGKPIRRTIYITEKQYNKIQEATTTGGVGNYQYDVPFQFKGDNGEIDPAYIHNKKGGIGCDRVK